MSTFAKYRFGRVALHLLCILRGGDRRTHLAGVAREFAASDPLERGATAKRSSSC